MDSADRNARTVTRPLRSLPKSRMCSTMRMRRWATCVHGQGKEAGAEGKMHVCVLCVFVCLCVCVFGKRGMRMMHGPGTDQQLDPLHDRLGVSPILLFLLLLPAFLHLVVGAHTNERESVCVCVREQGEEEG